MIITFIVECIVGCVLFTAVNITYLLKKPLQWFYDYPEEVQARMRTLPQYKDKIPLRKDTNLKKKLPAVILFLVLLSAIAWFSGFKGFKASAMYTFLLFMVINFYDALILDTFYFCHSKRVRFPGTEDMVKEYENPRKHWIGFAKGTAAGVILSLLVGGILALLNIIL